MRENNSREKVNGFNSRCPALVAAAKRVFDYFDANKILYNYEWMEDSEWTDLVGCMIGANDGKYVNFGMIVVDFSLTPVFHVSRPQILNHDIAEGITEACSKHWKTVSEGEFLIWMDGTTRRIAAGKESGENT